jgi:hypothetical protein
MRPWLEREILCELGLGVGSSEIATNHGIKVSRDIASAKLQHF